MTTGSMTSRTDIARAIAASPHAREARAFTLLELLVVLLVIALLAALLIPALGEARQHSYATRSSQNLRTLTAANLAYAADLGTYAPADDRWNNRRWHGERSTSTGAFDPTRGFLAPYLGKNGAVLACPLFTHMLRSTQTFEEGTGGYGYNATYIGGTPALAWAADGTRLSARPAQVPRPATTHMFATTAYARADGLQEYPYAEPPYWDFGTGPTTQRPAPTVHFRFRGRALIGWCDGHVTFELPTSRDPGENPHGGDPTALHLGWPGPDEENGWWNPVREQ